MFKSPLMVLFAAAAIRASSDGPCYNIDGSRDKSSSACYDLDTVGASMCCVSTEKCRTDGPFISASSVQVSLCVDGSFCPRSGDYINTTCCDNHQGNMAGLGQAPIAASLVSSIRSPSTASSSISDEAPSATPTIASAYSSVSSATSSAASASNAKGGSGGLNQESKV
ncbi:MAG: hypothetical protein Q9188_005748 [Gyalolechia gomerana]